MNKMETLSNFPLGIPHPSPVLNSWGWAGYGVKMGSRVGRGSACQVHPLDIPKTHKHNRHAHPHTKNICPTNMINPALLYSQKLNKRSLNR